MVTFSSKTSKEKEVKIARGVLDRVDISYAINEFKEDCILSKSQIADFEKTQQEFLEGKSTAKNWDDIKNRKAKKMETKNWKDIKDNVYGKLGTERRDELDRDFESFKIGLPLKTPNKKSNLPF